MIEKIDEKIEIETKKLLEKIIKQNEEIIRLLKERRED